MLNSLKILRDKRDRIKKDYDEIENAINDLGKLSPEQRIAIRIHELTCYSRSTSDHHSGFCGWKDNDWDADANQKYLTEARFLLSLLTEEQIYKVTEIFLTQRCYTCR